MAKLKRHSTHTHNEHVRSRPRLTNDDDAPFGSPVHALHEKLNQRVITAPNIHATPAARILYFVVIPAMLWAMIIQTARIL
jgi:hypothetical protein